jgi:hypothetical protein
MICTDLKPGPRDATLSSGGWRGREAVTLVSTTITVQIDPLRHLETRASIHSCCDSSRSSDDRNCCWCSIHIRVPQTVSIRRYTWHKCKLQAGQRHRHLDCSCLVAEPPTRRSKDAISKRHQRFPLSASAPAELTARSSSLERQQHHQQRGRRKPRDTQTSMLGSLSSAYVSTRLHA